MNFFEDEDDILDSLEDLFEDLSYEEPTNEQLYHMYGIFLDDFVKKPLLLDGIQVKFNTNISKNPICRGKYQGFEHIITRESKIAQKRNYDRHRANKIHWVRPVIENAKDSRIKYFEKVNDKGFNQRFYWYEQKKYVVIIREIKPNLLLITGYVVDDFPSQRRFQKDFEEYKRQKKTPLRK